MVGRVKHGHAAIRTSHTVATSALKIIQMVGVPTAIKADVL